MEYFNSAVQWASEDGALEVWLIIWGVLFASGIGAPLPEDIPLTLTGFLTFQSGFFGGDSGLHAFSFPQFAFAFCYVTSAILVGDSCCWWLGKRYGLSIRERFKFFRKIVTDNRLERVRGWFDRFGGGTVFLGRQVAGVRFVTFFTAGTVRMPLSNFLIWDFLGSLVSVPIWLTLGALGSYYKSDLELWISNTSTTMLIVIGALIVAAIIYFKFIRKKAKPATALQETESSIPDEPKE